METQLITEKQLNLILGKGTWAACVKYVPLLNKYMPLYKIDSTLRIAAFIAQLAHETGRFLYTAEIASGKAYEGRQDLGNVHPGDGMRYKGRGSIMITGYANYMAISLDTKIDFLAHPEWLSDVPEYFVMAGCWFWNKHQLNNLADKGNFYKITTIINGGTNGLANRIKLYNNALLILRK